MHTREYLMSLLEYNKDTGIFSWKVQRRGVRHAGLVAGSLNKKGYRIIFVDGKAYYAQRLAWLFVRGEWPEGEVDHENGVKDDNRWNNLEDSTHKENIRRHYETQH